MAGPAALRTAPDSGQLHACSVGESESRAVQTAAAAAQTAHRRLPLPAPQLTPVATSLIDPILLLARRPAPEGFTVRTEGKASILQRANDVFFNPAQVVNRDMSLSGEGEGERGP